MYHRSSRFGFIFALLCASSVFAAETVSTTFDPPDWKFGMIDRGAKVRQAVRTMNRESHPISLTFVSTCACLEVEPFSQTIAPGEEAFFNLTYDSSDDSGITRKAYIVNSDTPGAKPMTYLLDGVVRVVNVAHGGVWVRNSPGPGKTVAATTVTLLYYFTPGCRSCEDRGGAQGRPHRGILGGTLDILRFHRKGNQGDARLASRESLVAGRQGDP
jgi:hypothetical protein